MSDQPFFALDSHVSHRTKRLTKGVTITNSSIFFSSRAGLQNEYEQLRFFSDRERVPTLTLSSGEKARAARVTEWSHCPNCLSSMSSADASPAGGCRKQERMPAPAVVCPRWWPITKIRQNAHFATFSLSQRISGGDFIRPSPVFFPVCPLVDVPTYYAILQPASRYQNN